VDEPLPLVRDVLDKQIYDANGIRVGKVDGLILHRRANRPPRIVALEIHLPTAVGRAWWRLGPWLESLQRWLAPHLTGPTRIQFEHVVGTGIDVHVDIDARRTNAFVWETWLEHHVVGHLPGGRTRGAKD
jgi:hypothetical protein